jgi:hypothetical protein
MAGRTLPPAAWWKPIRIRTKSPGRSVIDQQFVHRVIGGVCVLELAPAQRAPGSIVNGDVPLTLPHAQQTHGRFVRRGLVPFALESRSWKCWGQFFPPGLDQRRWQICEMALYGQVPGESVSDNPPIDHNLKSGAQAALLVGLGSACSVNPSHCVPHRYH